MVRGYLSEDEHSGGELQRGVDVGHVTVVGASDRAIHVKFEVDGPRAVTVNISKEHIHEDSEAYSFTDQDGIEGNLIITPWLANKIKRG